MELDRIAIRAFFVYLVLLGLIRASGKRTLAQATPFDFVLTLILGDMIDDALWAEVPLARFLAGISGLLATHLVVSGVSSRSERLERVIEGVPTAVMENGTPVRAGLRSERLSENDLAAEVRHYGVAVEDWPDVEAAHVETSGTVSLLMARWARPAQRRDADAVRRAHRR